jgi:hypothetical protein
MRQILEKDALRGILCRAFSTLFFVLRLPNLTPSCLEAK